MVHLSVAAASVVVRCRDNLPTAYFRFLVHSKWQTRCAARSTECVGTVGSATSSHISVSSFPNWELLIKNKPVRIGAWVGRWCHTHARTFTMPKSRETERDRGTSWAWNGFQCDSIVSFPSSQNLFFAHCRWTLRQVNTHSLICHW